MSPQELVQYAEDWLDNWSAAYEELVSVDPETEPTDHYRSGSALANLGNDFYLRRAEIALKIAELKMYQGWDNGQL